MKNLIRQQVSILGRAAAVLVLLLLLPAMAVACPSCKQALASQEGGGDLVQGFFWSILFMVSMPFTILGVFSGCMYLAVRRARAANQAAAALQVPSQPPATASQLPPAAAPDAELLEV